MCLLMRISSNPLRPSTHGHHQGQDVNGFVQSTIHSVSLPFHWPHHLNPILCLRPHFNNSNHAIHRFLCAPGHTVHGITDSQSNSAEPEGSGSTIKDSQQGGSLTITKILEQLKRYGVSGILSYGILNTVYYLSAFLLVWFYFAPVPGKMGYLAAVTRFLKVMAMVWAGSQVTKLIRAAGYGPNFCDDMRPNLSKSCAKIKEHEGWRAEVKKTIAGKKISDLKTRPESDPLGQVPLHLRHL